MKLTIRTKILIGFALLFVISILTQIFTYVDTQNNFLSELNSSLTDETNKGAEEIESFFTNLYDTSNGLGKIYQQNYNSSNTLGSSNISTSTEYVLSQESEISEITYLSPAGGELYQFNKNGEVPQAQLSYEIGTNPFLSALSGETSVSKVYYLDGKSGPYLDIFSPVYQFSTNKDTHDSNNSVIAIIKMQISLESLSQSIGNIKIGHSGFMYVVDNTGLLIAHPNQSFVLQRPNLSSRKIIDLLLAHKPIPPNDSFYNNEKNIPVIAKAKEIPQVDWVAVMEEPLSEAYEFIYFVRYIFWTTFAGSAIFLIITAFILSKNITDPIKKLKEKAENIEKGQFQVSTIIESHDEIEVLSRSFDSMIKELLQRESLLKNEKQETEDERARLLASINNLSLGFVMTDRNDGVIAANKTFHQILKVDQTFRTIQEIIDYLKIGQIFADKFQKCKNQKTLQTIPDLKFGNLYLRFYFSPIIINNDECIGVVVLLEDITQAKLLEYSKDEFFAVSSHELRTPLTAIRGFTALILDNFQDQLNENQKLNDMIVNIHNSSIRLIKIVNSFLDASKIEQGKFVFNLETFALAPVIESALIDVNQLANEKNIYLKFETNGESMPDVYADQEKIKQVIINLIGNAIKFTEKGGITLSMKQESNYVKVLIKDTGLGISEEYRRLLFKKFQQAGERILTRDAATGSGMGLYISKLLIEAMKGSITIEETKLGEGSTFSFTIPIAKKS